MNGVHDMGGMHGMGPILPETNEPVFHEPWESRVFAMLRAMGPWKKWNIDASRYQRELIPAAEYLRMTYYEKWLEGLVELMVAKGLVTRSELTSGKSANDSPHVAPALTVDQVAQFIRRGAPSNRSIKTEPRFATGQRIRTRNINPIGHTRLPRYARDKLGVIDRIHGVFVFPDSNALFQGEQPQPLYSVRFTAQELWGNDTRQSVYIDLWEDYLDPAE